MLIRVVGAGTMGRGIAEWAAGAGHMVELADAAREIPIRARLAVAERLSERVRRSDLSRPDADAILARITSIDSPTSPSQGIDLVIEAIAERAEAKSELFAELEAALGDGPIFATNTSSLPVSDIASGLSDPGRLVGLHFFNPVTQMKIIEIVATPSTRPEVVEAVTRMVELSGHAAVSAPDVPGFLVNHAGRGLVTEALALLEDQVADSATIDVVARDVLGLRMGPFELMDLTGLDVTAAVTDVVWEGFRFSDRLRPSYLASTRVSARLLGRKTGRGFYDYPTTSSRAPRQPDEQTDFEAPGDLRVWLPTMTDTPRAAALLRSAGAFVEQGERASEAAVVVVPTWGTSVSDVIAATSLDPACVIGIDSLSVDTPRIVLAITAATSPTALEPVAGLLTSARHEYAGRRVSITLDTHGSVAQRLLSSIIGVAASIVERGIAKPSTIDAAVTLALGYPHGPLTWGDRIGTRRIHDLQSAMHSSTGDPRYRPTRWVAARASLGMSLTESGTTLADIAPLNRAGSEPQ